MLQNFCCTCETPQAAAAGPPACGALLDRAGVAPCIVKTHQQFCTPLGAYNN